MTIELGQGLAFMLVMLRMTGMLVVNPILGRRNIPVMVNTGLAFMMAVLLTSSLSFPVLPPPRLFEFFILALKEMAIGMVASFMMQMFLSVLIIGGEVTDMQLGIGMAKNFDPATNSSISASANLYTIMFILAFFATNNHLTFIHMAVQTFDIIPIGYVGFNWQNMAVIPAYFTTMFVFAVKLCLPLVLVEIVVTMAVGIIMRIIPQINVFVVNIQFKLLIGFFSMIVLVGPFMIFFENLIYICFENIQGIWVAFY